MDRVRAAVGRRRSAHVLGLKKASTAGVPAVGQAQDHRPRRRRSPSEAVGRQVLQVDPSHGPVDPQVLRGAPRLRRDVVQARESSAPRLYYSSRSAPSRAQSSTSTSACARPRRSAPRRPRRRRGRHSGGVGVAQLRRGRGLRRSSARSAAAQPSRPPPRDPVLEHARSRRSARLRPPRLQPCRRHGRRRERLGQYGRHADDTADDRDTPRAQCT